MGAQPTSTTTLESPPVDNRSNFGPRGWSIVGIQGALIWLAAGIQVHGLNIIVPTLSEYYGLDSTTLLYWATPASLGGVIAGWAVAKTCELWGAKINILVSLAASAIAFGLLGTWGTIPAFVGLFFLVNFFGSGFGYVGGINLIANWFPRKKNLALGWMTMGQTMSTALFVPMLAAFFAMFGVQNGFWAVSAILGLLMVIVALFVKNLPEEAGATPDNIPMTPEQIKASREAAETYRSPFTTLQLLKMKDVWLIGIGSGGIFIVLVAVLSQLVPRMMDLGYSQSEAITNMAIAAFIGVPGAYAWGWLGQRMSSRTGLMAYSAWWLVAVVANLYATNTFMLWVSLVMIGLSFGGATNLTTAIVADKFPRGTFVKAFGIIQPMQGLVRITSYAILAWGLTHLGGYTGAYTMLAGIALVNVVLFWLVNPKPVDEPAGFAEAELAAS